MNCDYHVHSLPFSPDSSVSTCFQIEKAIKIGMKEICLTDHLEVNIVPFEKWQMDTGDYYRHFNSLDNQKICIKLGLEVGISCKNEDVPLLKQKLSSIPFDFVIASVHSINGNIAIDANCFTTNSTASIFNEYIQNILTCIKRLEPPLYSCIGHIDFPTKILNERSNPVMCYSYAKDSLDELFRYLISYGKCIEINTGTYRNLGNKKLPCMNWLFRYVEMGGEFVTFGSDGHTPEQIGYKLSEAAEIARRAGIKYYATFEKMEPTLHKL